MFTGIIEEIGTVEAVSRGACSAALAIRAERVLQGTRVGDSIAVNGVCLTVTALSPGRCTVTAQADGERVSMDFLVPDTSLTVAEASMDRQFSAWLGGTPSAGGAALKERITFALTGYEDDFATYTVTLTTDGEVQSPVRLARLTLQAGEEVREVGVLTVDPEHDGDGAEHTFQVQVPRGMAGTLHVTGI